mmetsp:Transcript_55341/g.113174  ORF Transcript_55341/g.113174 Transcript_55341/m.113174 type:complete len:179 (-) Transcript_55341:309-845(-)
MGYAGYAPGHKVVEVTPLQSKLVTVKSVDSFDLIEKLTRNVAQNPTEEKYRKVRLTNEKIKAALVDVAGALDVLLEMGWTQEGEFIVLPSGTQMTMMQVRDIDDARNKFKKAEEDAFKKRAFKRTLTPEDEQLRRQLEADKLERAARGPITQASVATAKGTSRIMSASDAGCAGSKGG